MSDEAPRSPGCHVAAHPAGFTSAAELLFGVSQFGHYATAWHRRDGAEPGPAAGLAPMVLDLHALNFALWHHEDAARRPDAGDREVADRKRRIDRLNARRNAAIEHIDATLLDRLAPRLRPGAELHTETPGTIVDRLSVLTLRILHTSGAHADRLRVLDEQHADLCRALEALLIRLEHGEARYKVYRQYKTAEQHPGCHLIGEITLDGGDMS